MLEVVPANAGAGSWGTPLGWTVAIVALLLVVGLVVMIATLRKKRIAEMGAGFFFWLETVYLGLLLVGAILYLWGTHGAARPTLIGGLLPIAVPWFGALGAVMLSLEGVFIHNKKWDKSYNYWHIGRPLFGAALGIVAFFLFVLTINAAGERPKFLSDPNQTGSANFIVYYVVGFLVGYREETFRELIKRATDLVVGPGGVAAAQPLVTFRENGAPATSIQFDPVGANQTSPVRRVEILNSGSGPLTAPLVALVADPPTAALAFEIRSNTLVAGQDLGPGQAGQVELVFKPTAAESFAAKLTISGANLARQSLDLKGAGT
jgi:hypothetical protein